MEVLPTRLAGLLLLAPDFFADERGFFLETFNAVRHHDAGVTIEFVQDNHSRSRQGTIRGLHFQADPGQAKLVRVARGRIWDVVVDVRKGSPTFGQWEALELDDVDHHQLYVPVGFAHGFCAVSDVADVCYKVSSFYDPQLERGIAWDDPALDIPWPAERPTLSDRDRHNPSLAEACR
jgi:dTDP-4-dehydrorhamnose 3,5-epimerase